MKPVEVLAMIEEAAGTRMYEEKKEKAFKSIAKKDTKMNEILENSRTHFENAQNDANQFITSALRDIKNAKAELEEMKRRMDAIASERKKAKRAAADKKKEVVQRERFLKAGFEDFQSKQTRVRELEDLLSTLTIGVSAEQGHENGYMDQLTAAKQRASDLVTKMEQLKLKVAHRKKEHQELARKEKMRSTYGSTLMVATYAVQQHRMHELEQLFVNKDDLSRAHDEAIEALENIRTNVEEIESKIGHVFFSYKSPGGSFHDEEVRGIVAQLVQVKDKFQECVIALEIAAGGKLYNVVVDTEATAAELLKRGHLTRRVTFIPVNKINPNLMRKEKLQIAYDLAPGKAELALNVLNFDPAITPAVQYVFGNTLICQDNATAQKLTFDKRIMTRSVTVNGDVYDPSGTLSGGSYTGQDIITKLQKWRLLKSELQSCEDKLKEIGARRKEQDRALKEWNEIKKDFELRTHQIGLLEQQMASNENTVILEKLRSIEEEVRGMQEDIAGAKAEMAVTQDKIRKIEQDMSELSTNKGAKLKSLQKELSSLKTEVNKNAPTMKTQEMELEVLRRECKEIATTEDQIKASEGSISAMQAEVASLKNELDQAKAELKRSEKDLEDYRKSQSVFDEEYDSLRTAEKEKRRQLQEREHSVTKCKKELEQMKKDAEDAEDRLKDILSKKENSFAHLDAQYRGMSRNVDRSALEVLDRLEKRETQLNEMIATVKKDKKKIEETIYKLDTHKMDTLEKTYTAAYTYGRM
ncbi:Structural maintenance of chromosomes protein 2 [Phlyctochytrium bullatum]|nr:Structural maintenance of chromosomes protein 2 [Phlyctochytrium bullatum]